MPRLLISLTELFAGKINEGQNQSITGKISLCLAGAYLVLGNLIGCLAINNILASEILNYLFAPYWLIWIWSAWGGFNWLFLVVAALIFMATWGAFFAVGLYFSNRKVKAEPK